MTHNRQSDLPPHTHAARLSSPARADFPSVSLDAPPGPTSCLTHTPLIPPSCRYTEDRFDLQQIQIIIFSTSSAHQAHFADHTRPLSNSSQKYFSHRFTAAAPKQCEVCGTAASKYCCPRCSRRTCSMACSNQHKSVDACSGTRDRTAFVTMQQFDDRTLMSGEACRCARDAVLSEVLL